MGQFKGLFMTRVKVRAKMRNTEGFIWNLTAK
jgi:hypothetical protein